MLVDLARDWRQLPPVALDIGPVAFIDAVGTVHVDWDDGHSLGLVPGEDEFE